LVDVREEKIAWSRKEIIDVGKLERREIPPPYKPQMQDESDVSNYEVIPDSAELPPIVPENVCPFKDW